MMIQWGMIYNNLSSLLAIPNKLEVHVLMQFPPPHNIYSYTECHIPMETIHLLCSKKQPKIHQIDELKMKHFRFKFKISICIFYLVLYFDMSDKVLQLQLQQKVRDLYQM